MERLEVVFVDRNEHTVLFIGSISVYASVKEILKNEGWHLDAAFRFDTIQFKLEQAVKFRRPVRVVIASNIPKVLFGAPPEVVEGGKPVDVSKPLFSYDVTESVLSLRLLEVKMGTPEGNRARILALLDAGSFETDELLLTAGANETIRGLETDMKKKLVETIRRMVNEVGRNGQELRKLKETTLGLVTRKGEGIEPDGRAHHRESDFRNWQGVFKERGAQLHFPVNKRTRALV